MLFNLFKKKPTKYGTHIFTFPNGKKLFQLKEDFFAKLPNTKLISIQENSNYIAHLGVSKTTMEAGHKMIKENAYEIKILSKSRGKTSELDKKCDDQIKLIEQIETTRKEYDNTNEAIMVSLFDLFFFFENENIFEKSDETLELKRHYLNEYPYFRNFFFQKLNDYTDIYKVTFQNCIHFALAQTAIQEIVKDLSLTSIVEPKTN
jgi:hypothetical protein